MNGNFLTIHITSLYINSKFITISKIGITSLIVAGLIKKPNKLRLSNTKFKKLSIEPARPSWKSRNINPTKRKLYNIIEPIHQYIPSNRQKFNHLLNTPAILFFNKSTRAKTIITSTTIK